MVLILFIICFPLFIWIIKKGNFYLGETYVSSKHVDGNFVPSHYEKEYSKIPSKLWVYLIALLLALIPLVNLMVLIGAIIWLFVTSLVKEDSKIKKFFNKDI